MHVRWLLAGLFVMGCLLTGCDSGSSGDSLEYTFINDTVDRSITVWRNGGEEWEGTEVFVLEDNGDEYTVRLKQTGQIGFTWQAFPDGSGVDTLMLGNEIFFRQQ